MSRILHNIGQALNAQNVDFLVVGGFAVNAYGVSRLTKDLDLLIRDVDYERALSALHTLSYKELHRNELFGRLQAIHPPSIDIDLMMVSAETFAYIAARAQEKQFQGNPFRVPLPEDIIAMKLHACKHGGLRRELKDLGDIANIVESQKFDVTSDTFRSLCLRFGNQEIYDKLVTILGSA